MDICAREECRKEYERKTHNQKYCGPECCRIATNKRIMEKYYARQAQRKGLTRYCDVCKETKLSRYNNSTTCNSCMLRRSIESRESLKNMLAAISA